MTIFTPLLGILGFAFGIAGLIVYSLAPDKLWLTTLSEGLGLICLVWFFVAHFETLKAFSVKRSTRLGLNSILMVGMFAGIVGVINFLAARHSERWDFSETQRFTLAPQTYQILRGLTRPVKITVFAQSGSPAFNTFRDLLDSYQQAARLLQVNYVDPERQPAVARQYGITRSGTAILERESQSTHVTTPSEAEITAALIRVSKDTKKRIVFLEGHGERDITNQEQDGYSLVREAMTKQGYEVDSLALFQELRVPKDTSVLVVAGPRRFVMKEEQERIAAYVQEGGRLLVLLDPETRTNLEDLLLQWGVEAGKGALVDLRDRLAQGDLTSLMIRTFTEHEITQDFNLPILFPMARHLMFHDEEGKEWDFVPLARTSPRSWAESDLEGLKSRVVNFNPLEDVEGPLPLAAALTPKKSSKEGSEEGAIVVVGNSSFASNFYLNYPGNTDFLLHAIGWLAEERDLISITPKEPAFRPFIPNATQDRLLLYVQVLFLPTATFVWGLAVWRKRRRL